MPKPKFTDKQILEAAAAVVDGDNGGQTLEEYLKALLTALWYEEEGFSGKRPFGNGGWQFDVYAALVRAKLIDGKIGEDGCLDNCDDKAGEALVHAVIERLAVKTGK